MAMRYAEETALSDLDPVELGMRLSEMVTEALCWLEQASGQRASVAPAEGKWCAKEVVGHMIDSAVNNLQRIVRLDTVLEVEPEVQSQNYEQDEWVRAQHYADKDWVEVLELWRVLNGHIAWTMGHVARGHLGRICVFPDGRVTMGFLMKDYVAHMEYHLHALKGWLAAPPDGSSRGLARRTALKDRNGLRDEGWQPIEEAAVSNDKGDLQ